MNKEKVRFLFVIAFIFWVLHSKIASQIMSYSFTRWWDNVIIHLQFMRNHQPLNEWKVTCHVTWDEIWDKILEYLSLLLFFYQSNILTLKQTKIQINTRETIFCFSQFCRKEKHFMLQMIVHSDDWITWKCIQMSRSYESA